MCKFESKPLIIAAVALKLKLKLCRFQTEEDSQTAVALEDGTIITVAQYKQMIADQQNPDISEG